MPASSTAVRIRPMLAADVAAAAQVIVDGGWGDRTVFFDWAVGHPSCRPIVADDDGTVVGTGVATVNGRVGWVGAIFVATDRRRQGLGTALSAAVIADLERSGCATQVLIATDEGRPIYERLGFRIHARYVLATAPEEPVPDDNGSARPYVESDFKPLAALDRAATGEDRTAILRGFVDPATSRVATRDDGSLGGFVVRAPWGGRVTLAPEPDDAVALLDWRRRTSPDRRIVIGVLEDNDPGLARLADAGWTMSPGGPRLLRGEPLIWRPDWIYGQFTGALG